MRGGGLLTFLVGKLKILLQRTSRINEVPSPPENFPSKRIGNPMSFRAGKFSSGEEFRSRACKARAVYPLLSVPNEMRVQRGEERNEMSTAELIWNLWMVGSSSKKIEKARVF